jgi:hypothetical protein
VTRRNLRYCLELYEKTGHANLTSDIVSPAAHVILGTDATVFKMLPMPKLTTTVLASLTLTKNQ